MARQQEERRREPRRPIETDTVIHFTVAGEIPLAQSAKIIDISSGGIGIIGRGFSPGMILLFDQEKPLELPEKGVVVWTMETKTGQRAGVQFLH